MIKENNYRNLLEVLMEGEDIELQNYITKLLPECATDLEYIERLTQKVHEICDEVDMELDKYWVAEMYIKILKEMNDF